MFRSVGARGARGGNQLSLHPYDRTGSALCSARELSANSAAPEAGGIHLIPDTFKLFWTLETRKAIRYTVGIGHPGLYEPGEFTVGRKAKWPSWTPTQAMIRRNPAYAQWEGGMPGGPNNPLGARALYLYNAAGHDTMLRIHGTNLPRTIGTAVSNGCARLTNEHAIELYERVPVGTRVVLYAKGERPKMG